MLTVKDHKNAKVQGLLEAVDESIGTGAVHQTLVQRFGDNIGETLWELVNVGLMHQDEIDDFYVDDLDLPIPVSQTDES